MTRAPALQLVRPAADFLPHYIDALRAGWSPNNLRPEEAQEQLAEIEADAEAFVAARDDPLARGPRIKLPDGSTVPRLPGFVRWMWDGTFCGAINLRWVPGTAELPPHVLGHVGYSVVPWKRGRGYATQALAALLPEARALGLPHLDITTDPDNVASQRVLLANGATLLGSFERTAHYGATTGLHFRIAL